MLASSKVAKAMRRFSFLCRFQRRLHVQLIAIPYLQPTMNGMLLHTNRPFPFVTMGPKFQHA